mgnify:FL=1
MTLLDPRGSVTRAFKRLAPRPGALDGRSIGILDNSKPNARVLLERLAELLASRAGTASVKIWSKPSSAQPAQCLDEIARSVQVVLTGSAD